MVNQDLGRVAVVLRGEYDPEAQYERLDCVSYQGSSYLVRKHCTGVTPAAVEYYQLAALAGSSAAADAAAVVANVAAENADAAAGRADAAAGNAQAAADAVSGEVSQIKSDVADNAKSDAVTKRSLDALWKLNQGISYQFETDAETSYQKTVPSGAKLASVDSIGGHTEVIDGELVSADVESVLYDGTVAGNIPDAVRALHGYGWSVGDAHNSIERTDNGWQYVQMVGSVDLGTLTWVKSPTKGDAYRMRTYVSDDFNIPEDPNSVPNFICERYDTVSANATYLLQTGISAQHNTRNEIHIYDPVYSDGTNDTIAQFIQSIQGVMLHYELANPVITDITDLMDGVLDAITVETGGTLTFENTAKLDVPNAIEYAVKLSEVGA